MWGGRVVCVSCLFHVFDFDALWVEGGLDPLKIDMDYNYIYEDSILMGNKNLAFAEVFFNNVFISSEYFGICSAWYIWLIKIQIIFQAAPRPVPQKIKHTTNTNKPYCCANKVNSSWPTTSFIHTQACESHDHDHQWTDYAMVWLP